MRDFRIQNSSPPGDDGRRSISPFRGKRQGQDAFRLDEGKSDGAAAAGTPVSLYAYLGALSAAAIAFAVVLVLEGYDLRPLTVLLPLAGIAVIAERGSIRLTQRLEVSISLLPTLFAAVVLGPLEGMVVAAASMLGDFRPPHLKWAIYTCTRSINGGLAGLVAASAGDLVGPRAGSVLIATFAAVLVAQILEILFVTITLWLRGTGTMMAVLRAFAPVLPSSVTLYTAVVAPLALAYTELSPWSVLLFLLPAIAAQRLFSMYQTQRSLAVDLAEVNRSLERANLSFASALVTTLDARDRYTAGHSAAVAVYARDIAGRLGLAIETQRLAHLSGLLHDIGKIGVPPGILEKNGPLTVGERRKMEEHSTIGERILSNVEAYAEIARIVRHHHERIDGEGYPDGIAGTEIPMISRIICVADAYNAMTSDRPYRDAMPVTMARSVLVQGAGTQFDAAVVAAFDAILADASETYSVGARADFAVEAQAHPELADVGAATAA